MTTMVAPTVAPPVPPPVRMSYEEWLAWDYEGGLTEWVNGEVIFHMATTETHQKIVEFLHLVLSLFVRKFQLGKVHTAPYAMRSKSDGNAREPDLVFISSANLARVTDAELHGPADLAVEVVSDDNVTRDLDKKFYEYEAGGVREYWIIDPRPDRQRAFFYVLDANGRYQPVRIGDDAIYRSSVLPDFWLKVDWLWADEPDALAALAELQVISSAR